jgi:uncharacterized protein (DUF2147 family)
MPASSRAAVVLALAALLLAPTLRPARAQGVAQGATPLGLWLTENAGGVIDIERCGTVLCGRIAGTVLDPGEAPPVDNHGRPQCGLVILRNVAQTEANQWSGRITDPRNGDDYGLQLSFDAAGHLRMRGYLGIPLFGKTSVWSRYAGAPPQPGCRMTKAEATAGQATGPLAQGMARGR